MKKYFHQKLVRDKIPEIIQAENGKYKARVLNEKDFEIELKKKLIEEAEELQKANSKEIVSELADVLELVKSIAVENKIKFSTVEEKQIDKRKKRGGFDKKIFLIWSDRKQGK